MLVLKVVCFASMMEMVGIAEKKVETAQEKMTKKIRIKMKCDRGDGRERKKKVRRRCK